MDAVVLRFKCAHARRPALLRRFQTLSETSKAVRGFCRLWSKFEARVVTLGGGNVDGDLRGSVGGLQTRIFVHVAISCWKQRWLKKVASGSLPFHCRRCR